MNSTAQSVVGEVARWLRQGTGIDLEAGGRLGFLERYLEERVRGLRLPGRGAYLELLGQPPPAPERARLINAVTVGHTWFYRDAGQMEQISNILSGLTRAPLRIWVPGCSSGEDVYSLAMLTAEAGRDAVVLGTDINSDCIDVARRGRYDGWAIRELPQRLYRYLEPAARGQVRVGVDVLARVRFVHHNLLQPLPPPLLGAGFDLILCRNVLIYFHPAQVAATIARLGAALAPSGWLLLGAGEVLRAELPGLRLRCLGQRYGLQRAPGEARREDPDDEPETIELPELKKEPKMTKKKIMVVDDSEIIRDMVSMMLEEHGYQVVTLESPIGFMSALRKEKPDLVLMDVTMPALAGDKLVEVSRQSRLYDGCPIVLHSDRPEAELQGLAEQSGARGYIRKTNDGNALVRSIERFLSAQARPAGRL